MLLCHGLLSWGWSTPMAKWFNPILHVCFWHRQRNPFSTFGWCFLLYFAWYFRRWQLNWIRTVSTMGTKKKGILQGFIYSLSQIFVEKEPEIEIGLPTDVKHVAHIGWDSPFGTGPGWMNEFKTVPNFSAMSIGNSCSALSPGSSQDFGDIRQKSGYEIHRDLPLTEVAGIRNKQKRKRSKSSSSPKSSSSSSSSRVPKSKSKFVEGQAKPTNIEVA